MINGKNVKDPLQQAFQREVIVKFFLLLSVSFLASSAATADAVNCPNLGISQIDFPYPGEVVFYYGPRSSEMASVAYREPAFVLYEGNSTRDFIQIPVDLLEKRVQSAEVIYYEHGKADQVDTCTLK